MQLAARRASGKALGSVVLTLALALGATSCSGDDDPPAPGDSEAPAQSTEDATAFKVETVTTIGRRVGKLEMGEPKKLADDITKVVETWFQAAYTGGEYPRSDFDDAYPGFTPGAKDRAQQDKLLMTNKGIGEKIDGVTPTESRVWVDWLASKKRVAGVTARFRLKFRTTGDYERKVRVHGRLFLSKVDGDWKIFGYDVAKGGR